VIGAFLRDTQVPMKPSKIGLFFVCLATKRELKPLTGAWFPSPHHHFSLVSMSYRDLHKINHVESFNHGGVFYPVGSKLMKKVLHVRYESPITVWMFTLR